MGNKKKNICACNNNLCSGSCGLNADKQCNNVSDCLAQNTFKINYYENNYPSYSITGNYNQKLNPLSNWIHQEGYNGPGYIVEYGPVYMYSKIVDEFGEPDVVANQPGGICIWYINQDNNDPHHSIELKDQYVPHCVPAMHNDFLYSYIKIYIPPEKLNDVLSVSGSVGYDGLQKMLYARCASFEANMATLRTVFNVLNNKNTNYGNNIKNRYSSYEKNKNVVRKELLKNQKKYKKYLNSPYYDLAFPDGCPK